MARGKRRRLATPVAWRATPTVAGLLLATLLLPLVRSARAEGTPPPAARAGATTAPDGLPAGHATTLARLEAALFAAPDSLHAANEYRRAVIAAEAYDRALDAFARLTAQHPQSASAWLNHGYAYVDKIPAAGSITQVILANEALARFDRAIALEPSWIALYTRGNAYLYWPKVFGKGPLAVADLERAVELARQAPRRLEVHARSWLALGDAYWRTDRRERAREVWRETVALFPGETGATARLALREDDVDGFLHDLLDPNLRVDTDLTPLLEETPVGQ